MKKELRGHTPYCLDHGRMEHTEVYDSYFCRACDEWGGNACGDEECEYCAPRPERRSQAPVL